MGVALVLNTYFGFDSKANEDDIIFDKTIIDKTSLEIISGSEVDFKKK